MSPTFPDFNQAQIRQIGERGILACKGLFRKHQNVGVQAPRAALQCAYPMM